MTYSAECFTDESLPERIANTLAGWPSRLRGFLPAGEMRQAVHNTSIDLAILAPSLVAEIAPLCLLWHPHLPVWQMSAIMAASWALTWWLTWTLILAVKAR